MPLVGENDKLLLYRYVPKQLSFLLEDKQMDFNFSNIMAVEYINNYDTNLMNVLKLTLKLDYRKKLWLIKHRKKIKVKFEFAKFKVSPDMSASEECDEEFINDEFVPLFVENDTSIDSDLFIKVIDDTMDGEEDDVLRDNLLISEHTIEIYLLKEDIMFSARCPVNRVFTKDTMQNIVAELLTETDHTQVIMDKFENEEEYYELLVPCLPLYKSLLYLDQYFGFYENGAVIFYDIDTLYILNSKMDDPACGDEQEVHVNILVDTENDVTPGRGMVRKENDDEYYLSMSEKELNILKYSRSKEDDTGSEIYLKIINPELDDEDRSEDFNFEAEIEYLGEDRMKRYIPVDREAKFANTVLQARLEENESVIYINADNTDVSVYKPNCVFKLIHSEEKKEKIYKEARYRISSIENYFKPEGDAVMSCSHKLVLKKCQGKLNEEATEED